MVGLIRFLHPRARRREEKEIGGKGTARQNGVVYLFYLGFEKEAVSEYQGEQKGSGQFSFLFWERAMHEGHFSKVKYPPKHGQDPL